MFANKLKWLTAILALSATLAGARAQAQAPTINGVRHEVYASIALPSPVSPAPGRDAIKATVTALIRIADHARESDFYGVLLATFIDFRSGDPLMEKEIWHDRLCHQNRGLPKISFVGLNGILAKEGDEVAVSARPRHIGQPIPPDEIVIRQAIQPGIDIRGPFMLVQAFTQASNIQEAVKLYSVPCSPERGN